MWNSALCVQKPYRWKIEVSCLEEYCEPADTYLWFTLSTSERYDFHYIDNDGVRNDDWGYQVVSSNEVIVPFLDNGTYVFVVRIEITTETESEPETITAEIVLQPEITTVEPESETTAAETETTASDITITETAEP